MSAPDPADLVPMALAPKKGRMTAGGEAFRDRLFAMSPGTVVSAARMRSWFDEQQISPASRPGMFRFACEKGWLRATGTVDKYPVDHPRRGAWVLAYRVTGRREG